MKKEIKVIQSCCGGFWEDEAIYERYEYDQIRNDLKEYKASGFGPYRVVTRRVPIEHIEDLGPRQLWKLRQHIVLNSLYLEDYDNPYVISTKECYDFFMGYLDWLEEDMKESEKDYKDDMFFDLLPKYDTYHNLNEYAAAF